MKYIFFSAGITQIPFHSKRLFGLTFIFILVIGTATAAPIYNDTQDADSNNIRQLIKQAEKLARRGETAEAEKTLRIVLQSNPDEKKAKLALAYMLLKQRRFVEAYKLSTEVLKKEPENADAFAVLGSTLLGAGNFSTARIAFINALNINRKQAMAWAGLGTLDFYENRILDSVSNLSIAVFYAPDEPDFLFTLAQVSARAENYKDAAEAYQRFLDISPQTDDERRDRIKGLINFLRYLGLRASLYNSSGNDKTTVPFKLTNNRPVIQIKVNDKDEPLSFVLDTGSGISVISSETAKRLKIKSISKGGLARAIGGDGKFEIVYGFLKNINIGEVKIKNVPVYIRDFHSNADRIDGYIGLSLISKFLTTVDYGNSTFTLKKKS